MKRKSVIKGVEFDPDNVTIEEKQMLRELDEKGYLFVFDPEEFKRIYINKNN